MQLASRMRGAARVNLVETLTIVVVLPLEIISRYFQP
jgi:hypothetical protein